jgi:hypothetical protein
MNENFFVAQLVNYKQNDFVISGNPEVTHIVKTKLKYRRVTNCKTGTIDAKQIITNNDIIYETSFDAIYMISIIADNIDDIINVKIILPNDNYLILPLEYLKCYDKVVSKIIEHIGYKTVLNLKLANFISSNSYSTNTKFINLGADKLKLAIDKSLNNSSNIDVKFVGTMLDTDERQRIAYYLKYYNSVNLLAERNIDTISSEYNLINYKFLQTPIIVLKIKSLDELDTICLTVNNQNIYLTAKMLQLYNDTYETIIFYEENECLIKITCLFDLSTIDIFSMKVIYKVKYLSDSVDIMNDIYTGDKKLFVLVMNDNFYSCILYESSNLNQIKVIDNEIKLKELIIYYENKTTHEIICPVNNIKLTDTSTGTEYQFSKFDSELYQKTHKSKTNSDLYINGFCTDPLCPFPTEYISMDGHLTISNININTNIDIEDICMHIYMIGYIVY